jgi:glycosyltransferase involved in cell wall biosynthesis/23S rRNA U2552 (ribose-2'-O)-methylase RlmE/FtsJ
LKLLAFDQTPGAVGCYRIYFPGSHLVDRHKVMRPRQNPGRSLPDGTKVFESDFLGTLQDPRYDADAYLFQQFAWVMNEHHQPYIKAPDLFRSFHGRGKPIICDSDDDYVNPPIWNEGGTNAVKIGSNVVMMEGFREADLLTVSTPHLAEIYEPYQKNVRVLRNRLHWPSWQNFVPNYKMDRPFTVGWVGSFKWRRGDLDVLRGIIGPWLERNPDALFLASGSDGPEVHDYLGVPADQRRNMPLIDFDPETNAYTAIYDADVILIPLDMIPFNDGKSHLKGLEANASGAPFIASPSESYRWWTEDGQNGFLAKKPKDWFTYLDLLKNDRDLRVKMGEYGRQKAEGQDYSHFAHEWEDAWTSVVRAPGNREVARQAFMYGAIQKEGELAEALAYARGKRVVVEIGSAAGGTVWAWCQVAADDALIISIDLPDGIGGGHLSNVAQERADSFKRGSQEVHLIRGDSHSERTKMRLLEILDGRKIDFLFIDGDHTYDGVRQDWEMYGDLADIVGFHDIVKHTHPELQWCKVDDLWAEIDEPKDEIVQQGDPPEHYAWGGIGIVFKDGSEPLDRILLKDREKHHAMVTNYVGN